MGKRGPKTRDLGDRFWDVVGRIAEADACWPWPASKDTRGYGQMWDGKKITKAHRVSLRLKLGRAAALLPGEYACHTCHNPPCVNPAHLYLGGAQSNMDDMKRAGRDYKAPGRKGSASPFAVLTEAQVLEIRRRAVEGPSALAKAFGVQKSAVSKVIRRQTWRHLP